MNIFITGIAGFIGSHTAEFLLRQGHAVSGIDNFAPYYSPKLKKLNAADVERAGGVIHRNDLTTDDLSDMLKNAEAVFHFAAQPGISDRVPFDRYVQNNLVATHRLIEAAQRAPHLRCFVNISTSSVYGAHAQDDENAPPKPTSYYGVTKLAAEQLVLAYQREKGLPACSLRMFSVYGPRERPDKLYPRVCKSILEDYAFPYREGSEHHLRSFTFVGDAVSGITSVLDHLDVAIGEIFNIGSDQVISTADGIAFVEQALGGRAKFERRPKRAGDQLQTAANIEKARRLLGYSPNTPPEEGLRIEAEWYRDNIAGKINILE